MACIDLEKAYNRLSKEILWKALEKKGATYIYAIKYMCDRIATSMTTQEEMIEDFLVEINLH